MYLTLIKSTTFALFNHIHHDIVNICLQTHTDRFRMACKTRLVLISQFLSLHVSLPSVALFIFKVQESSV